MAAKRFTVTLERVGKTATMFRVPFDLKAAFGRAISPVEVRLRDLRGARLPASTTESATSSSTRGVKAATRVDAGDRVQVAMALGTKPRTVGPAPALTAER